MCEINILKYTKVSEKRARKAAGGCFYIYIVELLTFSLKITRKVTKIN